MALRQPSARTACAGLALLDVSMLVALRPQFGPSARHLAHPRGWTEQAGADRALAELVGIALWLAAAWLGVGLVAAVLARVPGTAGRCAAHLSRALLPRALRGMLAGSAGLGVLLAPLAAGAAPSAPPAGPGGAAGSSSDTSIPAPGWPLSASASPSGAVPSAASSPASATSVPAPLWPSSSRAPAATPRRVPRPSRPPTPTASPPTPTPPTPTPPPASSTTAPTPPRAAAAVRVQAGDCLWLIATRNLGADANPDQVAAEWPRWYAANKDVIGTDPSVIRPGQLLRPPSPAADTEEASR